MKKQSLKSNFIFQIIYQILILFVPLLISPYLTRVLGADNLGIYSYTYSIAYYFVLFAMLGIQKHGQRVIAAASDDNFKLRKEFWSLFCIHVIFSLIAILLYIIFIFLFVDEYEVIFWLQTIYVISALFDVTWLFYGIENFKSIVLRNVILKLLEIVLIFAFVKNSTDLWIYTLIVSGSYLICQFIMVPLAIKNIPYVKIGLQDIMPHIKPLLVLSISVFAISLYTVFDKTLLGIMTTTNQVAFYEYSDKLIRVPKAITSVIGTVMFPRMCKALANNEKSESKKYFNLSVSLTGFIGIGSAFGLAGLSSTFSILYYGSEFQICGAIIKCLCPVIIIISLGDIVRTQYMIPLNMDSQYIKCIIINAIVNLVLSFLLIPRLGIYGAVIGTVSAELTGLILECFICRKFIDIRKMIISCLPYLFSGAIMFLIIQNVHSHFGDTLFSLCLQFLTGLCTYIAILIPLLYLFQRDFLHVVLGLFRKKNS